MAQTQTTKATKEVPATALRFAVDDVTIGSNGENAKTAPIKMTARTGQPIDHPWWGRVVHDMAGMQLAKPRLPVDYCHDDESVIGFLNKFDTATGDLVVSGALVPYSGNPEDMASEVIFKANEGVPYEASINFAGPCVVEEIPTGMSTEVNGYTFDGPGCVIRQWTLRGVAVCPYGADMNTDCELNQAEKLPVTYLSQEKPMTENTEKTEQSVVDSGNPAPVAPEVKPEDQAQQNAEAEKKPSESPAVEAQPAQQHKEFVDAFGDKGARWFLEGKTFSACAVEYINELNTKHQGELKSLTDKVAELSNRLSALKAGGEPVSFSTSEPVKPVDENYSRLANNLGPNLAKFATNVEFVKPQKLKK